MVNIGARGGAPVGILLIRPGVGSGTGGGGCTQPQLAAPDRLITCNNVGGKGLNGIARDSPGLVRQGVGVLTSAIAPRVESEEFNGGGRLCAVTVGMLSGSLAGAVP